MPSMVPRNKRHISPHVGSAAGISSGGNVNRFAEDYTTCMVFGRSNVLRPPRLGDGGRLSPVPGELRPGFTGESTATAGSGGSPPLVSRWKQRVIVRPGDIHGPPAAGLQ